MVKSIKFTKSYCPICFKIIPAEVLEKNNRIYLKKICKSHGKFLVRHIWDDPMIYKFFSEFKNSSLPVRPAKAIVNLTNRCNMNCSVCYAKANEINDPDFDKKNLDYLDSYPIIFLSGGEPTLKDDLEEIVLKLKEKKKKVILLTNGIKFKSKDFVKRLKNTKLDIVILQFDSLNDKFNLRIRRKKLLDEKRIILQNLKEAKIPTYVVATMIKHHNIEELKEYFNYFAFEPDRFVIGIGLNSMMKTGRYSPEYFVSTADIMDKLCDSVNLNKKDFIKTTSFLLELDRLFFPLTKKRYISKCVLSCYFLIYKNSFVPLNRILDLERIINDLKKLQIARKNKTLVLVLGYLLFKHLLLNFKNQYFRILLLRIFKNLKFFPNIFLLNPLFQISVNSFPTFENLDKDFMCYCNFDTLDGKNNPTPSCLFRCKK